MKILCSNCNIPCNGFHCLALFILAYQYLQQLMRGLFRISSGRSKASFRRSTAIWWRNGASDILVNTDAGMASYGTTPSHYLDPYWCIVNYIPEGPFYLYGLTWIPEWISNHMPSEVRGEITYDIHSQTSCSDLISTMLVKRNPERHLNEISMGLLFVLIARILKVIFQNDKITELTSVHLGQMAARW